MIDHILLKNHTNGHAMVWSGHLPLCQSLQLTLIKFGVFFSETVVWLMWSDAVRRQLFVNWNCSSTWYSFYILSAREWLWQAVLLNTAYQLLFSFITLDAALSAGQLPRDMYSLLKTDALDQWCVRKLLGIKWHHHLWNNEMTSGQPHLSAAVQARRFSLFSHIAWMSD